LRKQQIDREKVTSLHFLSSRQIVASGETSVKVFDISGNREDFVLSYFSQGKQIINIPADVRLGVITDVEKLGANLIASKIISFTIS
jgi:hypothetical protein